MMQNTDDARDPRPQRVRVPLGIFFKALLPAFVATVIVVFFLTRKTHPSPVMRSDGMERVTLSQKDSAFHVVPPAQGGASGEVWYEPTGPALRFQLHASGLTPGRRYLLELQVDDSIYTVASYLPTARGGLVIDTALTKFEEGVCVGTNYDAPRAISGHHGIKFWIKRDGTPATGTMPGIAATAPGAQLACHGNGDGNYDYVLLENAVADFTGTDSTVPGRSQ
jgi:hypothetical protein